MTLDELIEELTRLRSIYGGETKVTINRDGDTEELDRVRISPDAYRRVELLS